MDSDKKRLRKKRTVEAAIVIGFAIIFAAPSLLKGGVDFTPFLFKMIIVSAASVIASLVIALTVK